MKRIMLFLLFFHHLPILFGQADSLHFEQIDTAVVRTYIDSSDISRERTISIDSVDQAFQYLRSLYHNHAYWTDPDDSLRLALGWIIEHIEKDPVNTALAFLKTYPYENLEKLPLGQPEISDTIPGQLSDTLTVAIQPVDSLIPDTLRTEPDSLPAAIQDTLLFDKPDSIEYTIQDSILSLQLTTPEPDSLQIVFTDSTELIVNDTIRVAVGDSIKLPFRDLKYIGSGDSLKYAVDLLINFVETDSAQVWLKNLTNDSTSLWLKNRQEYKRFWLKNDVLDSIGIWIVNEDRNSLKLIVDDGVYFRKIGRSQNVYDYLDTPKEIRAKLQQMKEVVIKPQIWRSGGLGAVNFAQGYLSNWVKGGESSVLTLAEINLFANYEKNNTKWDNNLRFQYGLIRSGKYGLRKNEDMLEINSKFGQKAFGQLGLKAIEKFGAEEIKNWYYSLLVSFKSQVAYGYNYPNDSVVVSKFMAPGYLMFVLGLDYKPNKQTSILISPITSKSTYVLDTALIDQTKYGIAKDRNVYREIGAYVIANVKYNFNEDFSVESKLGLFTNYINKPQNIDLDWEVILRMKITYYLNATISAHMIYDDDIHVPIFDSEGIKTGEGVRLQFKELISVGFSYKF